VALVVFFRYTTWKGSTGIAANECIHRLVEHSKGKYADNRSTYINGLEGFWAILRGDSPNLVAKYNFTHFNIQNEC